MKLAELPALNVYLTFINNPYLFDSEINKFYVCRLLSVPWTS